MNDKRFWHFFDNKTEFNQLFHEQVKREWLNFADATESQFARVCAGRGDIICKPIDGSSGQGISSVRRRIQGCEGCSMSG